MMRSPRPPGSIERRPFGITVWGMGQDASYGYVGDKGLRPINDAVPTPVK